jgi:Condensation domain
VRVDPAEPLAVLLARIQEQQSALTPFHYLSLPDIQRQCPVPGPLFDTLINVQNFPQRANSQEVTLRPGLRITAVDDEVQANPDGHYALSVLAIPGRRLCLGLSYRPDLVDREKAQRLASGVHRMFEVIATNPYALCRDLIAGQDTQTRVTGISKPA